MHLGYYLLVGSLLSLSLPFLVSSQTCPGAGIPGFPGFPGHPGKDGRDGLRGEKGEPAESWNSGLGPQKGQKGEPGAMGIPGKRGQSGEPGNPGSRGTDGPPGEPGEPGVAGVQHKVAFSVARGSTENPPRASAIRFTKVITNVNNDYNTETGHFRCRVAGTYYFVYHASLDNKLCILMKMDNTLLASFCDHRGSKRQVTSGGLAVYLSSDQEVWLETKDYRGMTGKPTGFSVFTGFLMQAH